MKRSFILFLSIISVLFAASCGEDDGDCPLGYIGNNCSTEIVPSSAIIESITVTRFPAFEANGDSWDIDGPADLKLQVARNGNVFFTSPQIAFNAETGQSYTFPSLNVVLDDPGFIPYAIRMVDHDDLSNDDFMGSLEGLFYENGQDFPSTLVLDDGGRVAFSVRLRYQFD